MADGARFAQGGILPPVSTAMRDFADGREFCIPLGYERVDRQRLIDVIRRALEDGTDG